MKVGVSAVSKASGVPYRYKIGRGILKKKVHFRKYDLDKDSIRGFLERDIGRIFNRRYKDERDLILNSGFTIYIGDKSRLFDDLESRKSADFLLLTYLGKMRNPLRANYNNVDLSNLIFVNRLNNFARLLQEVGGKRSKVMIAGENKTFDYDMFRFGSSRSAEIIGQTRRLAVEFGMKNVEIQPLEKFLGGSAYRNSFEESLDVLRRDAEVRNSKEFKTLFKVFKAATAPAPLREAVALYTTPSRSAEIDEAATESSLRYLAFQKARHETDFWGINKKFIRSTVSVRKEVITFKYEVGRLAPFQGISVLDGEVGTEFFYDVLCSIRGNNVTLPIGYYHKMPFLLDRKGVIGR